MEEVIESERKQPQMETINIMVNGEKLKTSSQSMKLRASQGFLKWPVLFHIVQQHVSPDWWGKIFFIQMKTFSKYNLSIYKLLKSVSKFRKVTKEKALLYKI